MSVRVPRSCHQLVPGLHAMLRLLEEAAVVFAEAANFSSRPRTVAQSPTRPTSTCARKPDACRIDIDLNDLRLAGLGKELHIREAGAGHDERVAFLQRVLRRRGAEQADAARRVRAVVGNDGLAEQRLDDRRVQLARQAPAPASRAPRAPAAGQDRDLRSLVDELGRGLEIAPPAGSGCAAATDIRAVILDVHARALRRRTLSSPECPWEW